MNKTPLTPPELKKIIQTTQAIEGYKPASAEGLINRYEG